MDILLLTCGRYTRVLLCIVVFAHCFALPPAAADPMPPSGHKAAAGKGLTLHKRWRYFNHESDVLSVGFCDGGRLLASSGRDRQVTLWQVPSGDIKVTLGKEEPNLDNLAVMPHGEQVASVSNGRSVFLWNAVSNRAIGFLEAPDGERLGALAFSHDNKSLAAGSSETGHVYVWNVQTAEMIKLSTDTKEIITHLSYNPGSTSLISVNSNGVYPVGDYEEFQSSVEQYIEALGRLDSTVRVWDVSRREEKVSFKRDEFMQTCASIGVKGGPLAIGDRGGQIQLWDLSSQSKRKEIKAHDGWVYGITHSPDGTILASVGHDRIIKFWNADDGAILSIYQEEAEFFRRTPLTSIAFSPDGKYLAAGSSNGSVFLFEIAIPDADIGGAQ